MVSLISTFQEYDLILPHHAALVCVNTQWLSSLLMIKSFSKSENYSLFVLGWLFRSDIALSKVWVQDWMVSEYTNSQEGNLSQAIRLKSAQPGLYLLSGPTSQAEVLGETALLYDHWQLSSFLEGLWQVSPPGKLLKKLLIYFPLTSSLRVT